MKKTCMLATALLALHTTHCAQNPAYNLYAPNPTTNPSVPLHKSPLQRQDGRTFLLAPVDPLTGKLLDEKSPLPPRRQSITPFSPTYTQPEYQAPRASAPPYDSSPTYQIPPQEYYSEPYTQQQPQPGGHWVPNRSSYPSTTYPDLQEYEQPYGPHQWPTHSNLAALQQDMTKSRSASLSVQTEESDDEQTETKTHRRQRSSSDPLAAFTKLSLEQCKNSLETTINTLHTLSTKPLETNKTHNSLWNTLTKPFTSQEKQEAKKIKDELKRRDQELKPVKNQLANTSAVLIVAARRNSQLSKTNLS